MRQFEQVEPRSRAAWRDWLARHHRQHESVWLVYRKKAAGGPDFPLEAGIEEALCFGWIDSLPRKLDADRSMLLMSPRKPGSNWSAINKRRAEKMIAEGRMTPAGQAAIDRAKADGSWDALAEVDALEVPADLQEAFAAYPGAADHFAAFPKSARRGILEWIGNARRAETRAKRVLETARLAAENVRANQWPR